MPGWMRKTMDYLGLSDGDEVGEEYDYLEDSDGAYALEDDLPDAEPVIAPPRRERVVRPTAPPSGTRCPRSRAGNTRLRFTTRRSPARRCSGSSSTTESAGGSRMPRETSMSRAASRSAGGCWAILSCGRS